MKSVETKRPTMPLFVITMMSLPVLVLGFPSGAPLSACSHLMPVHMDGELMTDAPPYLLILNDTTYSNHPIKLTVTTMGPTSKNFMAFMLQARSEFHEVAGSFSAAPQASRAMKCYSEGDTLTHTAAFIRPALEVIWTPPSKNIGKITIEGSISLNKVKFWPVKSEALEGTGTLDTSGAPVGFDDHSHDGGKGSGSDCRVATSSVVLALITTACVVRRLLL